jgi:hypothetical protein
MSSREPTKPAPPTAQQKVNSILAVNEQLVASLAPTQQQQQKAPVAQETERQQQIRILKEKYLPQYQHHPLPSQQSRPQSVPTANAKQPVLKSHSALSLGDL